MSSFDDSSSSDESDGYLQTQIKQEQLDLNGEWSSNEGNDWEQNSFEAPPLNVVKNEENAEDSENSQKDKTWNPTAASTTSPVRLSERKLRLKKREGTITQDELEQLRLIWKKRKLLRSNSNPAQQCSLPKPDKCSIIASDDSMSSNVSDVSQIKQELVDSNESDEERNDGDDGSDWEPHSFPSFPSKLGKISKHNSDIRPRASKRIASRVQKHAINKNSKEDIKTEITKKSKRGTPKTIPPDTQQKTNTPDLTASTTGDGDNSQFTVENISGTLKINGMTEGILRKKKRTTGLTPTEDLMLKALYREHSRLKRLKQKIAKDQSDPFEVKPATKPNVKNEERMARKRDRERELYSKMTPEQMAARSARRKLLRDSKSDEWKQEASQKRKMKRLMMTDEEKEVVRFKAMVANIERKRRMTEEDKVRQKEKHRQRWSTYTPEQKAFLKAKSNRTWRQNLSAEKKAEYCFKLRQKYHLKRGQVLNDPTKWKEAEENYQRTQQRYQELGIPKAVVVRGLSEEEKAARKRERMELLDKVLGRRSTSKRSRIFTRPPREGTVKEKVAKLMAGGMNMYQARRTLQTPEQRERHFRQLRITKAKMCLRKKLQQEGVRPEEVDAKLNHLVETFPDRKRRRRNPKKMTEEPLKCDNMEETQFQTSVEYTPPTPTVVLTQLQVTHSKVIDNLNVVLVPSTSPYKHTSSIPSQDGTQPPTFYPQQSPVPSISLENYTHSIPDSIDNISDSVHMSLSPQSSPAHPPVSPKPSPKRVGRPRIHPSTKEKPPLDPQSDLNAPCELCGKLMAKRNIVLHKRYSHNPNWVNNSCTLCSTPFPDVYKFYRHYRSTHGDLFPPKRVRTRKKQEVQQPWHGKRVNPTTVCSYCGLEVSKVNLDIHIKRRHTGGRDCHQCPVCPKKFKDERVMKAHHDKHHPDQEPLLRTRVACSRCVARFGNLEELKKHAEVAHPNEYYACPTCSIFRFSKETIKFHIMRCSGGAANLAKIKFSPELIDTTAVNHMITKCEVCDKRMVLASLRAHVKDMHGIVDEKLTCFRCDKTFKQHVFLVDHLDFCHGLRAEDVMEQVSRLHVDDKDSEQFKERLANPPMPPHKRPEYYERREERRRERIKLGKEGIALPKRWVRSPVGERVSSTRQNKVTTRRKIRKKKVESDTDEGSEEDINWGQRSQTQGTKRNQLSQRKAKQPMEEGMQSVISVEPLTDNEIKFEPE